MRMGGICASLINRRVIWRPSAGRGAFGRMLEVRQPRHCWITGLPTVGQITVFLLILLRSSVTALLITIRQFSFITYILKYDTFSFLVPQFFSQRSEVSIYLSLRSIHPSLIMYLARFYAYRTTAQENLKALLACVLQECPN